MVFWEITPSYTTIIVLLHLCVLHVIFTGLSHFSSGMEKMADLSDYSSTISHPDLSVRIIKD